MREIPLNHLPKNEPLLHTELLGEEMPYDFRKPHRHDDFECFLFREGGGTHYIDFSAHPITAFSVHLVFPGQVHLLHRRGARGHVIVCRKEFLAALSKTLYTPLVNRYYAAPCVYFTEDRFEGIYGSFAALQQELEAGDALSSTVVENHMSLMLAACLRQSSESARVTQDNRHLAHYHAFCSLLDSTDIDSRLPVAHYAAKLGLSTKVLNDSIRLASGKTCIDILQDRLLTEAKRRLLYTSESCKEIGYALAFRDSSYFTRFFKKLEGMTPVEFRAHWEEKYQHCA